MADDIQITRKVYVENNSDPVNQYLLSNGLAKEGDPVDRLLLENGDFSKVMDINRIKQHIISGLYLLAGDWVLDNSQGVSYWTGMRAYPEILSAQIKRAINTVDGVDTVLKYNFRITENNTYLITATVKVGNSEIAINEEINPSTLGINA
jgi:hypothetical protein